MGKRTNRHCVGTGSDLCQTRQTIFPIDVHRTGTANTLAARSPKSESRVDLVLDLKKSVQHHGSTTTVVKPSTSVLVHIYCIPFHVGLSVLIGSIAENIE